MLLILAAVYVLSQQQSIFKSTSPPPSRETVSLVEVRLV